MGEYTLSTGSTGGIEERSVYKKKACVKNHVHNSPGQFFTHAHPQVIARGSQVAVIGDGKLGLLIAQVLTMQADANDWTVTLFGRHADKMKLVQGCAMQVVDDDTATRHAGVC